MVRSPMAPCMCRCKGLLDLLCCRQDWLAQRKPMESSSMLSQIPYPEDHRASATVEMQILCTAGS